MNKKYRDDANLFEKNNSTAPDDQLTKKILASKGPELKANHVLLALAAGGGILVVGAIAPGILIACGLLIKQLQNFPDFSAPHVTKKSLGKTYSYCKKKKYIRTTKTKSGVHISLTSTGERILAKHNMTNLVIAQPKKWDGQWRMLLFDVPVNNNDQRSTFRRKIKKHGFVQLQKSVWVWAYPYPCTREIQVLADYYGIAKNVFLITGKIDGNDTPLRKHFNLT